MINVVSYFNQENKIMKNLLEISNSIENGSYVSRNYNESDDSIQLRMSEFDYSYYITTGNNTLHFVTKSNVFHMPLTKFDYILKTPLNIVMLLWNKLGDIPINDDEEIEIPFEHFIVGSEKLEIWHWFEWFFDISIAKDILHLE